MSSVQSKSDSVSSEPIVVYKNWCLKMIEPDSF